MDNPEDIKRKRISLAISIGIHAILIVLFLFILAWKEPYPPIPEYGIELNFGMDEAGSGDIQPIQETSNEVIEQTESETITEEEVMDETQVEESETIPETEEPTQEETTELEEVIEDSQMEDSPDVIEPPEEQSADDIDEEVKVEAREEIKPEKPAEQTPVDSQSNRRKHKMKVPARGIMLKIRAIKGKKQGNWMHVLYMARLAEAEELHLILQVGSGILPQGRMILRMNMDKLYLRLKWMTREK